MDEATPADSSRWWRPLGRGDRRALVLMVLLPTALFVVPALLGHPSIDADNLIQNFPLRVLSGRQLASGHLPLLNPYANSGTPLLGGMNAGALYPLTLLFAFAPPITAWVINLIALYATSAVGMFCLLRWHRLATVPSAAAALSFTYTGAMIGQVVHLGVVQGFSLLPWAILALLSLARRLGALEASAGARALARAALPSTLGFALLWGLTCLTGEPRAIADMELLTLVVVPTVLLARSSYWLATWRARVGYALAAGAGVAWGVLIGFAQLLPGWSFIAISQRSSISYWYYGAGSLPVRWTPMLAVQDMLGGNGGPGPGYFAHYNLPEVTGYAGLLALVAGAAFLTRLTRRGWVGANRDFVPYVVLGVVGLFATWGNFTPLGHLFHAIPLFGSTRLQSRNVVLVDLALSALLGWWLHQLSIRDSRGAGVAGRARLLTLAPAVVVAVFCLAMFAWGPSIVRFLGAAQPQTSFAAGEAATLSLHLAIAVATMLWLVRYAARPGAVRGLLVLLGADVVVFLGFCSTGLVGAASATMPPRAGAVALLGATGRSALVDSGGAHTNAYRELGVPNMNVFTRLPSVQGYGSLISAAYGDVTGTHPMSKLDPCQLARGTFSQLRLASVAVDAGDLRSLTSREMTSISACGPPGRAVSSERYFGQRLAVGEVVLHGRLGRPVARGPVRVQLLGPSGEALGPAVVRAGAPVVRVAFDGAVAGGLAVRASSGVALGDVTVTLAGSSTGYHLDTSYQQALSGPSWRLSATVGTFQVFRAAHVAASAWPADPSGAGRVTRVRDSAWGDSWVSVTSPVAMNLERSFAYLPGWRASAVSASGVVRTLRVERSGLIQEVRVPAGTWTVHFHYHAPHVELALAGSTAGAVAWLGVAGALALGRRRSKR
jgi:hypothetical protein